MTNSVRDDHAIAASAQRRSWVIAGCVLVLTGFYFVALFFEEAAAAVGVWIVSPTYNHAFLILPISLYLVWERRALFDRLSPRPDLRFALLLPLVGAAWLLADLASIMEGKQLAVMAMLQLAIVTIVGWTVYKAFLFPALYLFFLVPTGEYLVPPLQTYTAEFSVAALRLLNIPVFLDGIFISIPNGHFKVAEACAGLRFLIATIAFGFLFSVLMYRTMGRRIIFIALCIIIPIIANGFRALGIILIAYLSDNKLATGVDHIVYGWVFFSFVLILLIWIGLQFRDNDDDVEEERPQAVAVVEAGGRQAVLGGAIAVMVLSAIAPAFSTYLSLVEPSADPARLTTPTVNGPWSAIEERSDWQPVYPTADRLLAQSYRKETETVDVSIAFYRRQTDNNEVIGSSNKLADPEVWDTISVKSITIDVSGQAVPFVVARIVSSGRQRIVLQSYWIGSHLTISRLKSKVLQVYGELLTGNRAAAAILVSTDVDQDPETSLMRLEDFLQHVEPLDVLLERAG